jgi:GntR family transcriptional regulator
MIVHMLPFQLQFKTGVPAYGQVVYAVKKAIISGALKPGDRFPSVRVISQELRINPNTAHKVVAALINERLLEVKPGIGTIVADARPSTREQRRELLGGEVERVVVEAKKLQLDIEDVVEAIQQHWSRLSEQEEP